MTIATANLPAPEPYQVQTPTWQPIQALAENLDGLTVRNDFTDTIVRYIARQEKLVLWQLLNKRPATSDPVRDPIESDLPSVSFVSKSDLDPTPNALDAAEMDVSSAGQALKALSGLIQFSNFSRSLYAQQGQPFGDLVSDKTDKLIVAGLRELEKTCFVGNATTSPLQFNGFTQQMGANSTHTCDLTGTDSLVAKLRSLARLIYDQPNTSYRPTHIFTNGLGLEQIEKEVYASQSLQSMGQALDVVAGVSVPALRTQVGDLPIITTPHLPSVDGGAGTDTIPFYMVDMNFVSWRGLTPYGGVPNNFNPQIFDLSNYTAAGDQLLLIKRAMLIYGTLYVSRPDAVHKLNVTVASGTVGAI